MNDATRMRDAALQYAAQCYRVIPLYEPSPSGGCTCGKATCRSVGKHPRIRDWQHKATADPHQIEAMWQKWPSANMGLLCEDLVILDFDPKAGGLLTLNEWELKFGADLLGAPRNFTGRYQEGRGVHIRYRQVGRSVTNKISIAPGVDIKADGGFIVVAPSLHKSGVEYEWGVGSEPLLPPSIEALILHGPSSESSLEKLLNFPPTPGNRNDWMAKVCGHLAKKHRGNLEAYDQAAFTAFGLIDDHEDFDETQARKVFESIWKREHSHLPIISTLQTARIQADQGWNALSEKNRPPRMFRSGGQPVRMECNDAEAPMLQQLTLERMTYEMSWAAKWMTKRGEEWVEVNPPQTTMKQVLATPNIPLPVLTRIVATPVFGPNGELFCEPGYHERGKIFYAPAPDFVIDIPPERPSDQDLAQARNTVNQLLFDFPFDSPSDRAHAISLLFLLFVRDLIPGATPLHLINKPTAGTGASLLMETLLFPAIGSSPGTMSGCKDEDEWRKRLTAAFRSSPAAIVFDNLIGKLESSALSAALTQPIWEDRILGHSRTGRWPIRNAWVATANNLQLSTDIARRTVLIRLNAHSAQPWLDRSFRIDLPSWTIEHRAEIIWSALCVARAWLSRGRPLGARPFGSYEGWAKNMGGMMDVFGEEGFLDNVSRLYEASDADATANQWIIEAWWDNHDDRWIKTSDLFHLSLSPDFPIELGTHERGARIRLGKYIETLRDRHFALDNGLHVRVESSSKTIKGVRLWRLVLDE